jgi:two-component system NarL family sensor kinase
MRKIAHSFPNHYNPLVEDLVTEDLENALGQLDTLINKIRQISHNLSPSVLEDFGLEAALNALFRDFSVSEELEFSINMETVSPFLSQNAQIAIYRIFQEALTNVSKHAAATKVTVQISRQNDHMQFRVTDDGQGFDLASTKAALPGERGLGLPSIEERVHLLNGVSEIQSQIGQGTQLSFTLPYESGSS